MAPTITVDTFLRGFSANDDPFTILRRGIEAELYSHSSDGLKQAVYVLSALMGFTHVAWGFSYAATNRASQFTRKLRIPPYLLNIFFILGFITAPIALLSTTVIKARQWNRGVAAFHSLHSELSAYSDGIQYRGDEEEAGTLVDSVLNDANVLLAEMTKNLYRFSPPYAVCGAYALLAGVVMAIACIVQSGLLRRRISHLERQLMAVQQPSQKQATSAEKKEQEALLQAMIFVSAALTASMFAYFAVCIVGNLAIDPTPVFKISHSKRTHVYLVIFAFSIVDFIAVGRSALCTRLKFEMTLSSKLFDNSSILYQTLLVKRPPRHPRHSDSKDPWMELNSQTSSIPNSYQSQDGIPRVPPPALRLVMPQSPTPTDDRLPLNGMYNTFRSGSNK
ncbi:hypothetical protein P7C70_g3968, partial [Phenoliferia sp. Uapishka_3]